MIKAVKNDFAGYEELLHSCRYEEAKLGDDNDSVDGIAAKLVGWFADSLEGRHNERGGHFQSRNRLGNVLSLARKRDRRLPGRQKKG